MVRRARRCASNLAISDVVEFAVEADCMLLAVAGK